MTRKNTLDAEVLEYVSVDTLKNLDSAVSELGGNFTQVRAEPVRNRVLFGGFHGNV